MKMDYFLDLCVVGPVALGQCSSQDFTACCDEAECYSDNACE